MTSYFTRQRSSQETRSKKKLSISTALVGAKNVVTETPKKKNPKKVKNTKVGTKPKRTRINKDDASTSQTSAKKEKTTKKKILSEENVNNKVEPRKPVTRNSKKHELNTASGKGKITKKSNRNVSNLRQMSLKDSFLNQSNKNLDKDFENPKHDAESEKEPCVDTKKVPIYKCLSPEFSKEGTSEIYEFKFDINNSKERILRKKRKKKVTVKKTSGNKKVKNSPVKRNLQGKSGMKISAAVENKNPTENKNLDVILSENDLLRADAVLNSKKNIPKIVLKDTTVKKDANTSHTSVKPTIVSVEVLSNTNKVMLLNNPEPSVADDFKPFRPTNIFKERLGVQQKNAINATLLNASLSPITKASEIVTDVVKPMDGCSPWRVSPMRAFYTIKNVFQSTPQGNKCETISGRSFPIGNESKKLENTKRTKSNNENMSPEVHTVLNTSKKKSSLTSRKFGREITNLDPSLQLKSPIEQISERIPTRIESIENASNVNNTLKLDDKKSKEVNELSPKKTLKKNTFGSSKNIFEGSVIVHKAQVHQENVSITEFDEDKENSNVTPGPSGLQSYRISDTATHVLTQSNLNNFLNIVDMPERVTIKTSHGIFDDIQSTPVSSKSAKRSNQMEMDLQNAFGFKDDISEQEVSLVDHTMENNKEEKLSQSDIGLFHKRPAGRLSIRDIKSKLLTKESGKDIHNKENRIIIAEEIKETPIKKTNKQPVPVNFRDTFDVQSESNNGETSEHFEGDVSLFADCEPSFFSKPPQHCYKRKRKIRFEYSDEENDKEDEKIERNTKRKKLKTDKRKQEYDKRLKEWVKDVNRTFQEVDHHELVIE